MADVQGQSDISGGDAVVRALADHGVRTLYCVPGVQNDHLFNALHDAGSASGNGIRVVHARHEQGAAYMALGAALATAQPAVYSVVPGPGVLNTTAALATAFSAGAPVMCLAGQIATRAIGRGHGVLHEIQDQSGIIATLTKQNERAPTADDVPRVMASAFQALASGRPRPVGVEVPADVLANRTHACAVGPLPLLAPPVPDAAALEQAAALLRAAERPLIFVGAGAQAASEPLRKVAERLGAPVVSYRMGKGVLDDRHPLSQSLPGGHALWRDCDVVLAVGTRLQIPLAVWGTDAGLKLIKVDIDRGELDRIYPPAVGIVGDAAQAMACLAELLADLPEARPERVARSAAVRTQVEGQLKQVAPQVAFLRAIRDVLPDHGVLVDELTQVGYIARIAYEARRPRSFLSSGYQGTLGWGLPTGLGAKDALGAAPVVSITGDGGFMFNVAELSTAVHHRIPLVTVLFNDGAYGNVRRMQQEDHAGRVIATDLTNPDFVHMGESFGVDTRRASHPDSLRAALERALALDAPALIEVPCGELPSPWRLLNLPRLRGR